MDVTVKTRLQCIADAYKNANMHGALHQKHYEKNKLFCEIVLLPSVRINATSVADRK